MLFAYYATYGNSGKFNKNIKSALKIWKMSQDRIIFLLKI